LHQFDWNYWQLSPRATDPLAQEAVNIARACEVSLTVMHDIVEQRGDALVFHSWKGKSASSFHSDGQYDWSNMKGERRAPHLNPSMLKSLENGSGFSAVDKCENVRTFLKDRGIKFGGEAINEARQSNPSSDVTVVSLGLAALTMDGKTAAVETGYSGLSGGGSGWISIYSSTSDGNWQRTFIAPTWIA
jgi:hypothetical protein